MAVAPIFKGILFPFQKGPEGIPAVSTNAAIVKSDFALLLNTRKRERVMIPTFGLDLERLVFENTGPLLRAKIFREIADAVGNWEPRIKLVNVSVTDNRNTVTIDVRYQILGFEDEVSAEFSRE